MTTTPDIIKFIRLQSRAQRSRLSDEESRELARLAIASFTRSRAVKDATGKVVGTERMATRTGEIIDFSHLLGQRGAAAAQKRDARTVSAVMGTESLVCRAYGDVSFYEVLSHAPEHVDLGWMQSGRAPVCKDHNLACQTGIVDAAWISARQLLGELRFGRSPQADAEWNDVSAGVRQNLSLGYDVIDGEYQPGAARDGGDILMLTRWRPMEISVCGIGLDEQARIIQA